MQEITKGRLLYVRTLRRLIADETQCTPEAGQVLRTLSLVVDQLEQGNLHKLHPVFIVARRRIRSVPTHTVARERNQPLRKKLTAVHKNIGSLSGDHELHELVYVLQILVHILGVPPQRATLLPDKSTGTVRTLMHCIMVAGVAAIAAEPQVPVDVLVAA